jgi:hypothetical protein
MKKKNGISKLPTMNNQTESAQRRKASEILDDFLKDMGDLNDAQYHYVKLAMEQYGEQERAFSKALTQSTRQLTGKEIEISFTEEEMQTIREAYDIPPQAPQPASMPQEVKDKIILRGKELFPAPTTGQMNTFIIAAEYGYSLALSTASVKEVYVPVKVSDRMPDNGWRGFVITNSDGFDSGLNVCRVRGGLFDLHPNVTQWLEKITTKTDASPICVGEDLLASGRSPDLDSVAKIKEDGNINDNT